MTHVSREDHFSIAFPGEPAIQNTTYTTEEGRQVPARLYVVHHDDHRYAVTVANYTGHMPDALGFDRILRGSVVDAAPRFRRLGDVTFDGYAQADGLEGVQLQITKPDERRLFVVIYLHFNGRRLYVIEQDAPAHAPPPGLFIGALEFLNEEGERLQYEFDDQGNRVLVSDDQDGP